MSAKSHSFCTKDADTIFVDALRISERKEGRANFSWVVIEALKQYGERRTKEKEVHNGSSD